ncbi:MAG: hypothetical protein ACM3Q9_00940 [Methanosarcina sp.]
MANVPTDNEMKAALETWQEEPTNDAALRDELAGTLGDDSGEAKVKSAKVVDIEEIEEFGDRYRALVTFSIESEFRTNAEDPDTFGPHDDPDYKENLTISLVEQEGELRVTDVMVSLG